MDAHECAGRVEGNSDPSANAGRATRDRRLIRLACDGERLSAPNALEERGLIAWGRFQNAVSLPRHHVDDARAFIWHGRFVHVERLAERQTLEPTLKSRQVR